MKRKTFVIVSLSVLILSVVGVSVVRKIHIKNDPCYRVISGKVPSYIVERDRVCVPENAGQYQSYLRTMEGVDATSFEEIGAGYAKDVRHVYHGDAVEDRFDPKTFRHIGKGYVSDDASVAYYGKFIEGADPKTFTPLSGHYYAKDANKVYFYDRIVPMADPDSFEVITEHDDYGRDRQRVYYSGRIIRDADPESFVFLDDRIAKDREHVFCTGTAAEGLNAKTFERIGDSDYLRGRDVLYYCDKRVEGVDVDAFRVLPASEDDPTNQVRAIWLNECGTDGDVVVCHGEIQKWEDPTEFFSGAVPEFLPLP